MTSKLTITDERLAELVAFKPLPGTDITSATRDEWMAMAAELQERRKADSEPVAYIPESQLDLLKHVVMIEADLSKVQRFDEIPLYRHAQPVVPDAAAVYAQLSDHEKWSTSLENVNHVLNAFRAAMLAAAPQSPGSEPANVPGKWIPVSEQMPEVGVKVLAFPVEDEPIHAIFNGQLWLQDISWSSSDEPIDNVIPRNVTHWMPLPAAPQEPKP